MIPSGELLRHGRATLRRHARSFRVASLFLPSGSRDDAALLYAYCRELDDAVDEAPSAEVALLQLERAERSEVAQAFRHVAERRGFDASIAMHLVAGMRSDLGAVRIADDRALLRYCYEVAGCVGVMMCGVLGVTDPRALPHAVDLGVGMQLTNICRDVLEDAQRDRVYLPTTRLAEEGLAPRDVLLGNAEPGALSRVVERLLILADNYYRSADVGMRFIPWRSRLAIVVASRLYRGIGVRLRNRHGSNPLHGRTRASFFDKLLGVTASCFSVLAMSWAGRAVAPPHDPSLHLHLRGFPGAAVG